MPKLTRAEKRADKQYQQSAFYRLLNPSTREYNDSFSGSFTNFLDNMRMPRGKDWIKSGVKSGLMGNPAALLGTGLRAGLSGIGNSMGSKYYNPSKGEIWQSNANVPKSDFLNLLDAMYASQSMNPQQSPYDPLSPVNVTGQRRPGMGLFPPATTQGATLPGPSTTQPYTDADDPLSPVQVTGQRIPQPVAPTVSQELLDALTEVKVTGVRKDVPGEGGGRNARDLGSNRTGQTFGPRGDGVGSRQSFYERWASLIPENDWVSGKVHGQGTSRYRRR